MAGVKEAMKLLDYTINNSTHVLVSQEAIVRAFGSMIASFLLAKTKGVNND